MGGPQCQIHLGMLANNIDSRIPSKTLVTENLYGVGPRESALFSTLHLLHTTFANQSSNLANPTLL